MILSCETETGLLTCSPLHSASVASIVRVTAFSEVNINDITYTIVTASIFTTVEQSMGIICACLPTLRPLIGRLREMSKHSSDRTPRSDIPKNSMALKPLKSRTAFNHANVGDSRTGFAKLLGDIESGLGGLPTSESREATVTTHVGTSPSGFEEQPAMPETILRQQTLEQHHNQVGKH